MEIDQLRHVLKLAEFGNFTRAAETVGLSQPAFSRSIARLEEELGQPIFERQTKRVSLTDAGLRLHAKARQILSLIEDATAEFTDGDAGRLRVAAIPTIAPFLLPQLLREFSAKFPQATVIVQEDTTDRLLKQLSDGEIDVAILARPIESKYLDVEDLFEEELLLVTAADHPLKDKKQIRIADIEPLPFVLLGETHCLTDNVLSFCRQKSFHPVSVERTSQLVTVQELVALGHGVSLIPEMAARLDQSDRRIYRSLSGPRPARKIVLVTNPYRFQSRVSHAFCELTRRSKVAARS